jgi:hypothetical protein
MIHTLLAAAPPPDNCASPESLLPSLYKGLCNGSGEIRFERLTDFIIVLGNVIQLLLTLGGAAAVLIIIWGGIKYVTSEGNPDRTRAAQATIRNAVVGLVLSGGAYLLVQFFAQGLGGT